MSPAKSPVNVLAEKDRNVTVQGQQQQQQQAQDGLPNKPEMKSLEHHRQVLQSKIQEGQTQVYISPSDNIMSPCTAKLNALRGKQVCRAKPKSLFAQASAKKLVGENVF
ncbi:putative spo12-like protein [Eutypa lata UCREL1]|uniref:Putative spo12-like protein n=1 Tax=Eutypa lata (strain UCR-EL1) TaxID=1287681 RepID=M7T5I8_EUTLA|nr:putative spo12-like protein [Eutypa lata UCREL1]